MLAAKRSADVVPDVNLRNLLHTGNKAPKLRSPPGFETWGRHHQKSVVPQKFLLKKIK